MKKRITDILLVIAILIGLSLLLYPSLSDYWNSLHQSKAITSYVETMKSVSNDDYELMLEAAKEYNKALYSNPKRYFFTEEDRQLYSSLLDATGTGIMAYIEIPKINVELPIYHGTSNSVLSAGIGHLEGASLPVGGSSTHCVLSGHRGLPSAKLFTNLDKLEECDVFYIRTLNELLTYRVDQISIVLPSEVDALEIAENEDYCTLSTCTPYGINTHRLLVRGTRIENEEEARSLYIPAEAFRLDSLLLTPIIALPMLLVLLIALMAKGKQGSKNRGGDEL